MCVCIFNIKYLYIYIYIYIYIVLDKKMAVKTEPFFIVATNVNKTLISRKT